MINEHQTRDGSAVKEASPLAEGLLRIHKVITRGINISIRKCDEYLGTNSIPPGEAAGFSKYVSSLKWVTHAHHLSEDEIIFPFFNDRIEAPYNRLMDDHQTITGILVRLDQCLPEILSGKVGRLREVLGEFENLWVPHIGIEEQNFTGEKIQSILAVNEQVAFAEKLSRHGRENSGPGPLVLPFMIYNLEGSDREAFMMPFPWIIKNFLIPVLWKGQWKSMGPFFL